jgi:hypothetical protein
MLAMRSRAFFALQSVRPLAHGRKPLSNALHREVCARRFFDLLSRAHYQK